MLVPQHTDIQKNEVFNALQLWASKIKMIINIGNTKEIVFCRPNPRLNIDSYIIPIYYIEQVTEAKLLGVDFDINLRFCSHLNFTLKQCSQRSFLMKHLRCQGLSRQQLSIIFNAIIISRLRYALPAWLVFYQRSRRTHLCLSTSDFSIWILLLNVKC